MKKITAILAVVLFAATLIGCGSDKGPIVLPSNGGPLTVTASAAYNPVTMVPGGADLKIGSFRLQAGPTESLSIGSVKVVIQTDTDPTFSTPTSELVDISNLKLKNNGTTIVNPHANASEAGDSFSLLVFGIDAGSSKTLDVHADISTGFDVAGGDNYLRVLLQVTSGSEVTSGTTITSGQIAGQVIQFVTSGVLRIEQNVATTPVQQVLHAGETDTAIFAFDLVEITNTESIVVDQINFAVYKGENLFDYKLFDGAVQLGSTAGYMSGEVKFTGLNLVINSGTTNTLTLKASVQISGTLEMGAMANATVSYVKYMGQTSGLNEYISGGGASQTSSGAQVSVYDGTVFEAGDQLYIDTSANGHIAYTDGTCNQSENCLYTVVSVSVNIVTLDRLVAVTANARLVPVRWASCWMFLHDVEPEISTNVNSPAGIHLPNADQTVAIFNIAAVGERPLDVAKIRIKITGTWAYDDTPGSDGGNFPARFELWRRNADGTVSTVLNTSPTVFSGEAYDVSSNDGTIITTGEIAAEDAVKSSSVLEFDITSSPESVPAGGTNYIAIRADTTAIGSPASLKITLDGIAGAIPGAYTPGAVTWFYTNVAGDPSGDQSISDSYPISGNTLSY